MKRIKKYRRWQDAQLSLLGRLLLHKGLEHQGVFFSDEMLFFNTYGKPYFKESGFQFNISHSGNIVVCVISKDVALGVDIELVTDLDVNDYRQQLTTKEWAALSTAQESNKDFLKFWTKKEAIIKANGRGLSLPLEEIEVIKNHTKLKDDLYFTREIFIDTGYKCHVAFKGKKIEYVNTPKQLSFN